MIQCLTMTSLNTKNICFLAAFLFLSIVPTQAEVVNRVQDCNRFLHQGTPPNIPGVLVNGNIQNQNRYKVICQTYNGVRRYLTVYDTVNKIPVFSAYEYKGSVRGRPKATWKIEPQLDENPTKENINMRKQGRKTYTNQAVNTDYNSNGRGLDKGHLFPVNHALTPEDKISTFTLTNAVPQVGRFNQIRWSQMEQCIKCIMDYYISRSKMNCFVVVGAKQSDNNILRNRVNIPSMMWSAFYCNNKTSGAHWSNNDAVSPLHTGTLQNLRTQLRVTVFPQNQPSACMVDEDTAAQCRSHCSIPKELICRHGQKRPRSRSLFRSAGKS